MPIVFLGTNEQWGEISKTNTENECIRVYTLDEFYSTQGSLYLYLNDNVEQVNYSACNAPVVINAVTHTLHQLGTPAHVLRINGWHSFLQRPVWEITGDVTDLVRSQLSTLQKKLIELPDEIGFASAKVVSMVINEAYFALQEGVSTKGDIDIAMKLGTNYPYGPFEWTSIIGAKNVYELLHQLSLQEKRYTPSALLKDEAQA
jgi:3-hydroxybutyryl-CoA dehydrogenase